MIDLLYKDEVYAIVGAAFEVHNELNSGYLEAVYQEAMEIELGLRGIAFQPQCHLALHYKGRRLKKSYCADFFCYGRIVVEIKAADSLTSRDEAQLLNYLKATGFRVGVIINFGTENKIEWKRMVR